MSKYTIELHLKTGQTEYIPITAKNDADAEKLIRTYLDATQPDGTGVYLAFGRPSVPQRGYLNHDGASVTGKAWNDD